MTLRHIATLTAAEGTKFVLNDETEKLSGYSEDVQVHANETGSITLIAPDSYGWDDAEGNDVMAPYRVKIVSVLTDAEEPELAECYLSIGK